MTLAARTEALATRVGGVLAQFSGILSTIHATVYSDHEVRIQNALQKTTADASLQTVTTPVNFSAGVQSGGGTVVTLTATQTLTGKTLTTPIFNGWRQITSLFTASGDILTSSSVVLLQATGPLAIRLPAVTSITGYTVTIKNVLGTAPSTPHIITPRSGTIDGAANIQISTAYGWVTLVCTSSNWFVIGKG